MLKPPSDKITAETREKLLALADFIERDQKFALRMESFYAPHVPLWKLPDAPSAEFCGTSACIAGYLAILRGDAEQLYDGNPSEYSPRGAADLGLTFDQMMSLFHYYPNGVRVTRAHAVRVLRNFAFTGDVDWSV